MLSVTVLHMLSPQFSPPPDVSPQTLEPNLYLPSDPHSRSFDLSFGPYPALLPLTSHGCTSNTVSADITISPLLPKLHVNPTSLDVLQIITVNAVRYPGTWYPTVIHG